MMQSDRPFVLLGNGGHAKVVLAGLRALAYSVAGWAGPGSAECWRGLPALGPDDGAWSREPGRYVAAVGIGDNGTRARIQSRLEALGFALPPVCHPDASIAAECIVAAGAQIMAGAVVQPDADVGRGVIVNTGARVDHDVRLGPFSHVAPGATLCGGVTLGQAVMIGAGATIQPGVTIGDGATVGSGATVIRDVPQRQTVFGSPARKAGGTET